MNRIIFLLIFFFTFAAYSTIPALGSSYLNSTPTSTSIPSVEYTLPYPGILPDHPLYFLKVIRDRILNLITQDPTKKIQLNILLADKRIASGQLLWEKGNKDLSINTFSRGEKYLLAAALDLVKLKNKTSLPPGLLDKLEIAAKKHQEIITKLISSIKEETERQRFTEVLGITNQTIQQIASVK